MTQALLLYIDPGSGSYLLQVIIAAVLGVLFYFRNLWTKAKLFFTSLRRDRKKENTKNDAANT